MGIFPRAHSIFYMLRKSGLLCHSKPTPESVSQSGFVLCSARLQAGTCGSKHMPA